MKKPAVLIIDEDPSHLRISGWIIQSAGFESVSTLVTFDALNLPNVDVNLVLLDYHLNGNLTARTEPSVAKDASGCAIFFIDATQRDHAAELLRGARANLRSRSAIFPTFSLAAA